MIKKKIILLLTLSLFLGVIYFTLYVRAHSPSSMNLDYDSTSDELTANILHNVVDPNAHYVERVRIWINGSLEDTVLYTSQPTSSAFAYMYIISAENGDIITLTADCSEGGSITRNLIVGSTNGHTGDPNIPGFFGLVIIISISIFLIAFFIVKKRRISNRD